MRQTMQRYLCDYLTLLTTVRRSSFQGRQSEYKTGNWDILPSMFLPRRGNRTSNQMAAKFVILATVLCSSMCQWATATEEAVIKEDALKKLADHRTVVHDYGRKLTFQAENWLINAQTYTRLDLAGALKQRALFEYEQIGASYRFLSGLLNASRSVIQCIEETTQKLQTETEKFFYDQCKKPIQNSHGWTTGAQVNRMHAWNGQKAPLLNEYNSAYDGGVISIKKSDSLSEIKSITEEILKKGDKVIEAAKIAIADVRKIEMDQILFMDDKVSQLREYTRKSADDLGGALENCYLLRTPFFNLRSIFARDDFPPK